MKVRSTNPALGTARTKTSRYETSSARYMSTHSATNGPIDVARESKLRPRFGWAYGLTPSRQDWSSARISCDPRVRTPGSTTGSRSPAVAFTRCLQREYASTGPRALAARMLRRCDFVHASPYAAWLRFRSVPEPYAPQTGSSSAAG